MEIEIKVSRKNSLFNEVYHANLCGIKVPRFKSREKAIKYCEEQNWQVKNEDGQVYELLVHSF